MNLLRVFVKRPVLTTMVLLVFVVLGVYSYRRMVIEMMPNVEFPVVVVSTVYPGASPSEVESQITKKVEDAVSTIANVKNLTSYSMENVSQVVIEFELETSVDIDAMNVKEKVDAIMADLPEDAENPAIMKFEITSFPIMELAVSGPRPLTELYRVADQVVRERLSRIDGVAEVTITGKREREIRVEVDPARLRAYGLSLLDVMGVLAAGNLNVPAGHITRGASEITLRMVGDVASPAELAEFRLPLPEGGSVPLSEVADVLDTTEELRESATYNGEGVIGLSIIKRSDGNTVEVAREVRIAIAELRRAVDPDISIILTDDSATFVEDSVKDVLSNIAVGIVLTALLLLLFLHDWRQTIVAALAMPFAVVATFLLMDSSGFTLNVMTLMALGISIGTLITNAIVIIENCTRLVHLGMEPAEAAVKGTAEVAVAILASTLTNIVVFTPIAFMSGIIGRFFIQFGLTVVYATVFALLASFTAVPMLTALFLRREATLDPASFAARLAQRWNAFYAAMENRYRHDLDIVLNHRGLTIGVTLAILVLSLFLFAFVGGEFMPVIDQNRVVVQMSLPAGTSLERTRETAGRIEEILRTHPEVAGVTVKIGGENQGVQDATVIASLVPVTERSLHVTKFMNVIRPELAGIPDADVKVLSEEAVGGEAADLVMQVLSNDPRTLQWTADTLLAIIRGTPGLVEVESSSKSGKPEIAVVPRRREMAERGLTTLAVGSMLRAAYEGVDAGVYREGGEEYTVKVKYAEKDRSDPAFLRDFPIPSAAGHTVPLSDLGRFENRPGASQILHRDKQRMIEVSANIASGSLSEVRRLIDARVAEIGIPAGVTVRYGGYAEIQDESFASMFSALILAIVLVYIVLAAIMESFIHPVTIMLTLPLALIGVAMGLFFSGKTINIFSLMSIIMLVGIVVNNAILLLDYTAQLRAQGRRIREALLEACPTRLRPIIMANLAIAVGMLPQAIGGSGLEFRSPMAVVQVGGVLVSTVLTLYVIPVAYTIIDRFSLAGLRERRARRKA